MLRGRTALQHRRTIAKVGVIVKPILETIQKHFGVFGENTPFLITSLSSLSECSENLLYLLAPLLSLCIPTGFCQYWTKLPNFPFNNTCLKGKPSFVKIEFPDVQAAVV